MLDLELGPLREEASAPYVHPKNLGGYYRVDSERVLIDPTFPTQIGQKVAYPRETSRMVAFSVKPIELT